jgi:hypothetical protein
VSDFGTGGDGPARGWSDGNAFAETTDGRPEAVDHCAGSGGERLDLPLVTHRGPARQLSDLALV